MLCSINVVDSICGSGKSTAVINLINDSPCDKKFLYITPLLSEVERIKNGCSIKNFCSPEETYKNKSYGTKMNSLKYLMNNGRNIVSTHSLFRMFDEETIDLSYLNEYTLILDEVADVLELLPISIYDLETLREKYTIIEESGKMIWTADTYVGEFDKYKKMCELNCVSLYDNSRSPSLLWMFPISIFNAFKEIYILTYMFDAQIQKYYYDYYNIQYNKLYIRNSKLTEEPYLHDESEIKKLINICDNAKMNTVGDLTNSLSRSWYERNKSNIAINTLKNNCVNFFKHIAGTPSSKNLWTTYKEFEKDIRGNGYSKCFKPINTRATNSFINRESVAYLCNIYLNPYVKNFFLQHEIRVDEEKYALSELLQFIFRSRIRVGQRINLYLPSSRMRNILYEWINS